MSGAQIGERIRTSLQHVFDWLGARPQSDHSGDDGNTAAMQGEPLVSSDYVVELVYECIRDRIPVVLAGPRGCGKSRCAFRAIELAVERGVVFGDATKVNGKYTKSAKWGTVTAQGNKEVPRDYLMEDEARIASNGKSVSLQLKEAPILRFAERTPEGGPAVTASGELMIDASWNHRDLPFVVMLDEINRFSDGVLDSLLLLLEEGKVLRDGVAIGVNCSVVMTMNPPGYDGTAKRLSPPLQARLGRMLPLCTPDFTSTYEISRSNIYRAVAPPQSRSEDDIALRKACLTSLALWGAVQPGSNAYRYLTKETFNLLGDLAKRSGLTVPMKHLASECNYGPDVRGVRFWVLAAQARRNNLASSASASQEPLVSCLRKTFDHSMLHRLSTRFVEGSSGEALSKVEQAARAVMGYILDFDNSDPLLQTAIDQIEKDANLLTILDARWGLDPRTARNAWQASGLSDDEKLVEFIQKICVPVGTSPAAAMVKEVLEALQAQGIVYEFAVAGAATVTTRNRVMRSFVKQSSRGTLVQGIDWMYMPSLFGDRDDDDVTRSAQQLYDRIVGQLPAWVKEYQRLAADPNVAPGAALGKETTESLKLDGKLWPLVYVQWLLDRAPLPRMSMSDAVDELRRAAAPHHGRGYREIIDFVAYPDVQRERLDDVKVEEEAAAIDSLMGGIVMGLPAVGDVNLRGAVISPERYRALRERFADETEE